MEKEEYQKKGLLFIFALAVVYPIWYNQIIKPELTEMQMSFWV